MDLFDLRAPGVIQCPPWALGNKGAEDMRDMRHGVGRLAIGPYRLGCRAWSAKVGRSIGLLVVVVLVICALAPSIASAEPLCTDTWTGPAEGEWQTAVDWSMGKVPGSSDVACIGSGKTVEVGGSPDMAGVVEGAGTLTIPRGSLELTNSLEESSIHSLVLSGGTLTGAGTLKVTGSFAWKSGTMSGSGSTVVASGASGSKEESTQVYLSKRTLINEGTFTVSSFYISVEEGAEIKNSGTFTVTSDSTLLTNESGKGTALFLNTGILQKTAGVSSGVEINFENLGTVNGKAGLIAFGGSSTILATGSLLEGSVMFRGANVTGESFKSPSGTVTLENSTMTITSGSTFTVANFVFARGTLTGAGTLKVTGSFAWKSGTMSGSGSTVVASGASGSKEESTQVYLSKRTLINEGTFTVSSFYISVEEGAEIKNIGTFTVTSDSTLVINESGKGTALFVNTGILQKTAGISSAVEINFENFGSIREVVGKFTFKFPVVTESSTQFGGASSGSVNQLHALCGDPVSCATGNYSESQADLSVGGRGVGLDLTRTYNSQAAAEGAHGTFGYGWTSSFCDHLVVEKTIKKATLFQANGATVPFVEGTGGSFTAPAWTQDMLSGTSEAGYTLTIPNQTKFKFSGSSGRLESVTDRNGNATTLTYNEAGHLETITDPASRKMTLTYNGEGLVESVKDPLGHVVKYTYESGNLATVTEPGEVTARWQFKYDGSHEITEMIDGRAGKTVNEYNGAHQVISQKDPAERILMFEYEPFHTKITNKTTGSVTDEHFTSNDEPYSITHGFGTASATTESFTYNEGGYVTSVTDGNGHATKYGYNAGNDRTSQIDPNSSETKWTYDATHDVETMTTPKGETTTIKRDSHGNAETVSRPAPKETTQTTKYTYDTHGDVETMTDPLSRVWKYEYDTAGDRTAEIDPASDKRTWTYNEDSQEISTVSPRGNVTGGKPTEFTTKIERDAQGRPLIVTDQLGHTTKYAYDGNGNLETLTDGNGHKTTYTYNADNQPIKVKAPNGATTETEYDGAGRVLGQTDGNKHTTKYVRNAVGDVTEAIDPLGRKTIKEYDAAGNLKTLKDAAGRTTTYTYDPGNRLTEVSYSDVKTHTAKYEYDADGDRTSMTDGTGTTSYTFDQLDRLTENKDGHGDKTSYEYDLANQQTKITYPNGKSVTRVFDKVGRLEKVTDWLSNVTKFAYDVDSDLTATTFPTGSTNVDKYAYNRADQMTEVKMAKGAETLASLVYTRDNVGQLKKATSKGLPGVEVTEYTYDENNRLTKAGATAYEYDVANNPTKEGASTNTFDIASELEKGTGFTYTYDELGERTKTTPTTGPATTYGYDQAGNLISVERPKEGSTEAINDTYVYDGNGLRTSQTISGSTNYLAWGYVSGDVQLLLADGTNSYIYGPNSLPIEQISSGGTVTYLHHDQQGSTRLLTGSTGTVTGSTTFDAYGSKTGSTGTTTTPLGYDAQYTSSDTGLIYLRARVYDPATAQFLSSDPLGPITREPYGYGGDNPVSYGDPTGLIFGIPGTPSLEDIGTRFVGFWDGFTQPVFGGTAALRSALGLNGGLETCSAEYQTASGIGNLDASLEAGAVGGGVLGNTIRGLGFLRLGAIKLAPVVAPIASGAVGGTLQTLVAGHELTPTTVGQGAVGGVVGELSTGLVPGTSAPGVAGAVNTAFGFVW
jgi:RHS repeat-associated protein